MSLFQYIKKLEHDITMKIENECVRLVETNVPTKHNHSPMMGIIDSCKYCQMYGNILEHGEISIKDTELKTKLLCFDNN
jgi:hypothetical protein